MTLAMPARASLLVGRVMHRRLRPAVNRFSYPVFFVQVSLRDLPGCANRLFGVDRPGLMSLHQADHGPRDGSALLPWIEALLKARGLPHDGDIVLQAFPRVLGFVFNPVSFWYCHDADGALMAVLAEVNNTFGERHSYLLHNPDRTPLRDGQALLADKAFHVSPFNRVEGGYRFRFHLARNVKVARIDYDDGRGPLLLTAVSGEARPWSARALAAAFLRMPALTFGVVLRIHWQALKLWAKGVPFVGARPHGPARALEDSTR